MHPLLVEAAGKHHLIHGGGEIPLGPGLLGKISQIAPADVRGPPDLPPLGRQQAQKPPQQRGFAGAVVTHDTKVISLPDGEVQVRQDALPLIAQGYVPAGQQFRCFHGRPPLRHRGCIPR